MPREQRLGERPNEPRQRSIDRPIHAVVVHRQGVHEPRPVQIGTNVGRERKKQHDGTQQPKRHGGHRHAHERAGHGGYPLIEHLRKSLEGPSVWTPGVRGACVVSRRGGDFLFESGQDLSIGYDSHDREVVRLYLEESFSFRVVTPEAAVALPRTS